MPKLKSIKKLEKQKTRCISLNNTEGLYVTDDYIITHNSPATVYTQVLGGWNQKKAAELLLDPFMNILETSPYFVKARTHAEIMEKNDSDVSQHIYWTTSTSGSNGPNTSCLQMQNKVNYKVVENNGRILGQSQPLDSKILMADNTWKKMGDIKIGDKIASPTEKEQTVLGIYPQGIKKCYEITLKDGRKMKCSPDHLFKISWKRKRNGKRKWVVKPLQFILDNPDLDIELWDYDCDDDIEYIFPRPHL